MTGLGHQSKITFAQIDFILFLIVLKLIDVFYSLKAPLIDEEVDKSRWGELESESSEEESEDEDEEERDMESGLVTPGETYVIN